MDKEDAGLVERCASAVEGVLQYMESIARQMALQNSVTGQALSREQRLADNLLILHVSRLHNAELATCDPDSEPYRELVRRCYLLAARHVDRDPQLSDTPPY